MLTTTNIDSVLESIDPDLRPLILTLHSGESWVHKLSDVDEVVTELSCLLPRVVSLPVSNQHLQVVDKLIFVLAHLEVEVFFVSLLYLQRGAFNTNGDCVGPGWGSFLHSRAVDVCEQNSGDVAEAKAVVARISAIMRSAKLASIFLQNSTTSAYLS